jgi:hypothetical protein
VRQDSHCGHPGWTTMEISRRSRYDPEWDERTWKRFGNVSRRQVELETFSSVPEPSVLFAFATLAAIDCRTSSANAGFKRLSISGKPPLLVTISPPHPHRGCPLEPWLANRVPDEVRIRNRTGGLCCGRQRWGMGDGDVVSNCQVTTTGFSR